MSRKLQFAKAFFLDFERYYDHLAETDPRLTERAYEAVSKAISMLEDFPFIGRRAMIEDATVLTSEVLIPLGTWDYVELYEIEDAETVPNIDLRHTQEDA